MAVKILDICIACGACIDECPTEAIVDDDDNPVGEDIYFVHAEKCVECIDFHDEPACAASCPTEDCIVWDAPYEGQPSRDEIGADMRKGDTAVVE